MADMPPSAPHATHLQLLDEDAPMSTPTNTPPNEPTVDSEAIELIMRHIIEPLEAPLPDGSLRDNHTTSLDTRAPILYDRHLPSTLRLRKLEFDADMLETFKPKLFQELTPRKALVERLLNHPFMLNDTLVPELQDIAITPISAEESVRDMMVTHLIPFAARYATLALVEMKGKELDFPKAAFMAIPSPDRETKADFVVTVRPDAPPVLTHDNDIGFFFGGELKNVLAGNPLLFLTTLLLIAAQVGHPDVVFPWPSLSCHDNDGKCGFPESHRQLDLPLEDQASPPPDAQSSPEPLLDADELQTQRIRAAIAAVVAYIPTWKRLTVNVVGQTNKTGATRTTKTTQKVDSPNALTATQVAIKKDAETLATTKLLIAKLFDEYSIPVEYRSPIKGWLEHALYVSIQAWSQMVRHNTTFHLISTYQLSWVIRRHRKTGTGSFSQFFHPQGDKSVLAIIGLIISAVQDAQSRAKENPGSQWKDPYTRRNQAEQKAQMKTGKRERDEDPDNNGGDNQRNGQNDGPGGGDMEFRKDSDDPSAPKKRRTGGGDQQSPNDTIDLQQLHLAFQTGALWSDGFSVFQRINQHSESSHDQPTLPFPRSQLFPESLAPPDLNIRERRPSADSLVSTVSASTSSAPSLFSTGAVSSRSFPITPPSSHSSFVIPNISPDRTSLRKQVGTASVSAASPTAPTFPAVISKAGIFLDTKVATGAVGTVWSGYMILEGSPVASTSEKRIIMKITIDQESGDNLEHEAKVYAKLSGVGPRYYGLFEDGLGTKVLLIDYLGKHLDDFNSLSAPMRHELFDKALNMHKVGICHHDLEPRNILVDDDKHVHIVDFHVSSYNHVCRDPCDELVTLAKKIGLDNSESKMDENS